MGQNLLSFIAVKSHRKQQQQQQQQKQDQRFNKETAELWDSSSNSDADLSEFIPVINTHYLKKESKGYWEIPATKK